MAIVEQQQERPEAAAGIRRDRGKTLSILWVFATINYLYCDGESGVRGQLAGAAEQHELRFTTPISRSEWSECHIQPDRHGHRQSGGDYE